MSLYSVYLVQPVEISVHVDAEDAEAAIEAVHAKGVPGICANCSGWGQDWSRDDDVALEETAVFDHKGEQVWSRDEQEGGQRGEPIDPYCPRHRDQPDTRHKPGCRRHCGHTQPGWWAACWTDTDLRTGAPQRT